MGLLTEDIAGLLKGIHRAGDFCTSGTLEIPGPGLEVEGVGPIAMPLLKHQAKQLVSVAHPAPYGRGAETIVDTDVRRTWQIEAEQVRLTGRTWEDTLATIVGRVAEGLSADGKISAELYKLLLYEKDSFFLSHRDSEKQARMFATLVISFPSACSGGELVVRHNGREEQLDLAVSDPSEVAFAAFYADCPHEVLPVTSGYRLSLVYNLCRSGKGKQPAPPDYSAERGALTSRLRDWNNTGKHRQETPPAKLVYPFEHAYTDAGLSFDMLKGQDAARVAALVAAAEDADCTDCLALLSVEEWGWAEYGAPIGYGFEADYEVGEVEDSHRELAKWRRPDGSDPGFGPLPLEDDEVSPPGELDYVDPDNVSFQEASGNAGVDFEHRYQCAVLVVWPRSHTLQVLGEGGLAATLPYLIALAERCAADGSQPGSPPRDELRELAGLVMASWPRSVQKAGELKDEFSALLAALGRLGDAAGIERFLQGTSAAKGYAGNHNPAIIEALALLPAAKAEAVIAGILDKNAARAPGGCANLLARAAGRDWKLDTAARCLVEALRGSAEETSGSDSRALQGEKADFVVDLLTGLGRIDASCAETAVDVLLARPEVFAMDGLLVPAAVALSKEKDVPGGAKAAIERLAAAVAAHLQSRISLPLAPPADWKREANVKGADKHIRDLNAFLADPERETWKLSAKAEIRKSVEEAIRKSKPDLKVKTLEKGRPYTLMCTKNEATYRRHLKQRKQDEANMASLLAKWPSLGAPPAA